MKTAFATFTAAALATSVMGQPLAARATQCNIAPPAAANSNIKPIAEPSVKTAEACKAACEANSSCKSFVFGLPANVDVPVCELFNVPAAQVPSQGDQLYVFDVACEDNVVPNTAPTHDSPRGEIQRKLAIRDAVCNVSPSGAADASVEPIATPEATTAEKCQEACLANDKCQSFLFGLPDGSSSPVCRLFNVAAADVPARDDNLFVFGRSCGEDSVPTTEPTQDEPRGEVSSDGEKAGNDDKPTGGDNKANNGQN